MHPNAIRPAPFAPPTVAATRPNADRPHARDPTAAGTEPGTLSSKDRIHALRDMYSAIESLRTEIRRERRRERGWKRTTFALGTVALLLTIGIVAAISSSSNTFYGIQGETNTVDTTVFTLTSGGIYVGLLTAAAGTTNSFAGAVEILVSNGAAGNTAISLGDWTYQVTITEAGANTFAQSATAYYKAELFLDGTSKGAVYFKNAVGDALTAEGIVVKWSLGSDLPSGGAYVVKVTRIAS